LNLGAIPIAFGSALALGGCGKSERGQRPCKRVLSS
jgi:hypothetical protein